jgi:hypothetical protein
MVIIGIALISLCIFLVKDTVTNERRSNVKGGRITEVIACVVMFGGGGAACLGHGFFGFKGVKNNEIKNEENILIYEYDGFNEPWTCVCGKTNSGGTHICENCNSNGDV